MKKMIIVCLVLMAANSSLAQKNTTKKPVEEKSSLSASTAGKYAKDLARDMHRRTDFQDRKTEHTLQIHKWKTYNLPKDDNSTAPWYLIDITIKWQSASEGWPTTWNDVSYNGILVCDEFGCEANFIIKTKVEPSSKGLAALVVKRSPTGELTAEQQQGFSMMDDWFTGVNYVWNPGRCLND